MTNTSRKKKKTKVNYNLIMICASLSLVVFSALLILSSLRSAAANTRNNFVDNTKEKSSEIHEKIYETVKEIAEHNHHVLNRGSITVGSLREESKLEVYKVYENEYVIENATDNAYNMTQWLKITGTGTFVVNLQLSEFIIDDDNQIVTIRIPGIELEQPQIVSYHRYFNSDDFDLNLFVDKEKAGSEISEKQKYKGLEMLTDDIKGNSEYHRDAVESTKTILTNLIKGLNPNKNIKVIIEFINE